MNKGDLIHFVARDVKITKVQAAKAIDSLVEHITRTLKRGERTSLVGFGTFSISRRKARTGRNPQTGAPLRIPAKKVVKFTTGKGLRAIIK
ncbi:MAG TPA: HU family DNA-binding protein [Candidatus Polarisedimenticolia bacterium]|jgi:DNA-binding protein HU-beta|nr:HU family DNA-binding protein [Candidatus Polarisedimenticolia bacterium]